MVAVEEKEYVGASCCGERCGTGIGRGPAPTEPQLAGIGETPEWGSQHDGGMGSKAGSFDTWEQECGAHKSPCCGDYLWREWE